MNGKDADTIKILSFDPGTTVFGWAYSEYNPQTNTLEVSKTGDIKATKIAQKQKENVLRYGRRLLALRVIYDEIKRLLKENKPDYVVCEDAFYNPRMPMAYGPLLLCCHTVENILFNLYHYPNDCADVVSIQESASILYKIAPRSIKLVMSGTGKSFKSDMILSLEKRVSENSIKFKQQKPFDVIRSELNEHKVDAIACGYTFSQIVLPQLQPDTHRPD